MPEIRECIFAYNIAKGLLLHGQQPLFLRALWADLTDGEREKTKKIDAQEGLVSILTYSDRYKRGTNKAQTPLLPGRDFISKFPLDGDLSPFGIILEDVLPNPRNLILKFSNGFIQVCLAFFY
jgi:hypothetical protein